MGAAPGADATCAAATLRESLGISVSLRDANCGLRCLEVLGRALLAVGSAAQAARLFGTAATLRETFGVAVPVDERPGYDASLQALRRALGTAAYAAAFAAGRAMTFEQAAAQALAAAEVDRAKASERAADGKLTRREREVAALVAQGLTSRELAARLVIAERTAETHVEHILAKLGYRTRAQVAAWAVEQGLAGPEIRTEIG